MLMHWLFVSLLSTNDFFPKHPNADPKSQNDNRRDERQFCSALDNQHSDGMKSACTA